MLKPLKRQAKFVADDILNFFFIIFQRKQVLTFDVNHLPTYDSHEMSKLVSLKKKKKK